MNKCVIEVIGVAGTGKSHLCRQLEADAPPQEPRSRFDKLRATLRVLPILPILPSLEVDRTFFWLNSRIKFSEWEAVRVASSGRFVLDEGPWHFLIGSLLPRVKARRHDQLIARWPHYLDLPDIIVHLRCPAEVIQERRGARGRQVEKSLDLDVIRQTIEQYEQHVRQVKALHPRAIWIEGQTATEDDTAVVLNDIRQAGGFSIRPR